MNADLLRLHERIDRLEAMILDARKQIGDHLLLVDKNAELRRAIGAREKVFPRAWGLTRQESLLLSSLMAGVDGYRSFAQLRAALFVREIAPSDQGVCVVVSRIRGKFRQHQIDVEVLNRCGEGYQLPRPSRDTLQSMMRTMT